MARVASAVRIGVVGLEPGTHWSAYLNAPAATGAARLATVAVRQDLRAQLNGALDAAQASGTRVVPDADALFRDRDLDVLAVCTVPDEQADLVVEGLRRGLHVVVDKPLVTTRADLLRVEDELRTHPYARLSMLLTLRGDPVRVAAHRLARDGVIGDVVAVQSRRAYQQRRETRPDWFFDEERSGGPWLDGAIHGIDEVLWIMGRRIDDVVARDENVSWPERTRFYDTGLALFRLRGGGTAVVEHQRLALNDCALSILGTRGKIEIDRRNRGVLVTPDGERALDELAPLPPPRNVFADFVDGVASGSPSLVDTPDVIAVMRAALAARDSSRQNTRVKVEE
jgi:predicted dehydrogenase